MMPTVTFLDALRAQAQNADAAEAAFRREISSRIAKLEQERAFAYRRINLMQAVAEAVAQAEDVQIAGAVAQAVLRVRLGWSSDSEARSAVLTEFAAVGRAVFGAMTPSDTTPPDVTPGEEGASPIQVSLNASAESPEASPDVPTALTTFERWYVEHHTTPFWVLFEHYIPETPRVDF